jgi:hypothetical protein
MARPLHVGHATKRDIELARIANRHGAEYSLRIILEARRHRHINISDAFGLFEVETGFRNVFGCDWGPGIACCHLNVTEARARAVRRGGRPNGIGPGQLTSFGYVDLANRDGGVWKPGVNIATSLDILEGHIAALGRVKGIGAYNGGRGNPVMSYYRKVNERAKRWHQILT